MVDRRISIEMFDRQIDWLANDSLVANVRWANEIGCQIEHRIAVEFGSQTFFRKFDPIAFDTGKGNFERVTIWPNRMDPDRLARFDRRRNDRLGGEVERDAEDVGILDIEQLFLVEIVGLSTQPAPDDLFTKKLSAEGPDSENVCNRVGVPPLGQHRHRDHTTDRVRRVAPVCRPCS